MCKTILLLIVLFLVSSSIYSQINLPVSAAPKIECVRESWLTIYKGEDSVLFQPNAENDVYEEIKRLLLDGQIRLWSERKDNEEDLTSPLPSMICDSIPYRGYSFYYNPYFDYKSQGYENLKTITGKDSVFVYPDGSEVLLYPSPKFEPVTFEKISEIRIKEILIYDSINNVSYLKPSLVGFDVYAGHHNLLFWVKVDDLVKTLKINKQWIEYIVNKKYSGFVYKRNPCNDPDYQWKKVYH